MAKGKKRKIKLVTTHAVATYILNDLILNYNKEYPEIVFDIITNDQVIDVILSDVDIAIKPYDPTLRGVHQEPFFTLEKCLYASVEYIEKYGEPKTIEDLVDHHMIAFSHSEIHPYANISWILSLGMPEGKFHEPIYTANSIECLIGAAKKGLGIIASYEKMTILKEANLKKVLPQVTYQEKPAHFIYPKYLSTDSNILGIKNYLYEILYDI